MNFSSLLTKVICLLFCLGYISVNAQNSNAILFKSGNYTVKSNIEKFQSHQDYTRANGYVGDNYYKLISFSAIPTESIKQELNKRGIDLLQYIPDNTFYASIKRGTDLSNLKLFQIESIEEVKMTFKLSSSLAKEEYPDWSVFGNKIAMNAIFYPNISKEVVLDHLNKLGVEVELITDANVVRFKINNNNTELVNLYNSPHFYYFEEIDAPEVPEGTIDRTCHRSNTIATDYSGGLKFDGTGVTVMLQDNSRLDDHIDYTGRFSNHFSAAQTGDHGEHTGGIIAAAGNKDPRGRGMAHGADVLVYGANNNNFTSYVPSLYSSSNLTITSKSYGNGNNAGYTSLTRSLDQQTRIYPSLIHVFSAGNSGSSDFGYGAGAGWGNITGGHKQGKNVIAVGNVSNSDGLASSSSRGPAHDGRIKPDICAVGTSVYSTLDPNLYQSMTGTSMSCPGVAGVLAQLYHAYKDLNASVNPKAGLMKAVILNTADDLGNDGPDYKFGWGRVNARRAYEVLNDNNYLTATVSQGGNNAHNINVPIGTKQLRVMVYWSDYEAAASASQALVNDINMQVVDPGSTTFDPWVLDETPNATTLDLPATRGVDDLNNMEQVTIDNPTAGIHTVNVNGLSIPQGPQEYYVVYEFIVDEVVVTFPIGGEGLPLGVHTVRWDSNDDLITSTFLLEYTTDNGSNWNTIVSGAPGTLRKYNWIVPNVVSGEVKLRITQGAFSDESDDVFSLIGTPINLNVAWACPDSLNLTWNAVSGATGYEVYLLGSKYMETQGTTNSTNFVVAVPSTVTSWLSVRSLGPANAMGERAIAIEKIPGTFSCGVGIQGVDENSNVRLYPNPANDKISISGLQLGKNREVVIHNIIGEKVFEKNIMTASSDVEIDINNLKVGVYIIKITSNEDVITRRFVKE